MGETGRTKTRSGLNRGMGTGTIEAGPIPVSHRTTAVLVIGLLVAYWGSVGTSVVGLAVPYVRETITFVLLTIVPGALLYALLVRSTDEFGLFFLYAVALSVTGLTGLNLLLNWSYFLIDVERPLSFWPSSLALTGGLLGLVGLSYLLDRPVVVPRPSVDRGDRRLAVLLIGVVVLAVLAGHVRTQYQQPALMYPAVLAIAAVVLLTPALPVRSYPATLFSLGTATLLHRNLVTEHVIGVDIQATYRVAVLVREAGFWDVTIGGSLIALPIITVLPVIYSVVGDIALAYVFKVVFSVVAALLPVGIYYLARDHLGARAGLFGGLFFLFYHTTFYYSPGKEILAELFLVCMLIALFSEAPRRGDLVLAGLFGASMIQAHYAVTFIYTFTMAAAVVGLWLVARYYGAERPSTVSGQFVLALLTGAFGWYMLTSGDLAGRLFGLPMSLLTQLEYLLTLNFAYLSGGSGAGVAQTETSFFQELTILCYMLLMVLAGIGALLLVRKSIRSLKRTARRMTGSSKPKLGGRETLLALSFPLFAFLGMSVFVIVDLNIDRSYQIVFLLLAPFVAVGYRELRDRLPSDAIGWGPVVAVLLFLLLINTGLIPQATGEPTDPTFDEEFADYAFSDAEVESARWIAEYSTVEQPRDERLPTTVRSDTYTQALLRSTMSADYHGGRVGPLKNEETGEVETGEGYVMVRERALVAPTDDPPLSAITPAERSQFNARMDRIYDNGEMEIYLNENDDE